jgi:hypothetical protein
LATRFLPGSAVVPCIVEALLPDLEIKQRALNELIYGMSSPSLSITLNRHIERPNL